MAGTSVAHLRSIERAAYERGMADALSLAEAVAAVPAPLVTLGAGITRKALADAVAKVDPQALHVLRPYDPREALGVKEAAGVAGASESAVRTWCRQYAIGRLRVGSLMVSRPALAMLLDDDLVALVAYLRGDRGPIVQPYFARIRP